MSCVRAVKWAAWHLQLQPLGLNKGRSLAAFPTQLSPFYHGFHSCFVLSVSLSLYRVHTMRRHLGRVHSSVFSIFSPCFWLPAIFFFFLLSSTDQSQSDGNQRFVGCNPFANSTRFFVDFHDPWRCCSSLVALADSLFHSQFRSTCSLKSPLSFDGSVQNDVSSIRSQIGAVSLNDLVHYGGRNLEDRILWRWNFFSAMIFRFVISHSWISTRKIYALLKLLLEKNVRS